MSTPDDPTQAVPAAAVIGGRYRLDNLVGRGGTAEVWQATDTSLDRVVALKLVTVAHDESSARAADEARTLARLSHPSLVQVYDAGTDSAGRPWVVMEFVDGETLADAIRRGPQPVRRITEIGIAVADALDHVHARGLVHRDVKPANVLMGRGGKCKLTDFGIARLVDAAKVTSTGLMVGTASYLAPEQVAGEPVGPATDVYALGLVLLEALTGKREYVGPAVEAAMARLHRPPAIAATL
ncbi:MAG: putative serine/threonine protein kinase, partial [Frankiales bacterium]|nr:putative serine/threonine protein kinase [Frankiales bacterium]